MGAKPSLDVWQLTFLHVSEAEHQCVTAHVFMWERRHIGWKNIYVFTWEQSQTLMCGSLRYHMVGSRALMSDSLRFYMGVKPAWSVYQLTFFPAGDCDLDASFFFIFYEGIFHGFIFTQLLI
jgi:hypothetical protein